MANKFFTIDLKKPRRRYFSDEYELTICPECGSDLIPQSVSILLLVESSIDEADLMTNIAGSHFCMKCPVVVFDKDKLDQAALLGIRGKINVSYRVGGIIDLNAIPDNKKHLPIGTDENPMPLVRFLPDLRNQTFDADKKQGRNDPCNCGSGMKYKKCCGK